MRKIAGREDLDAALRLVDNKVCFCGLVEKFDESLVMLRKCFDDISWATSYVRQNVASDRSIEQRIRDDDGLMDAVRAANELDIRLYQHVCETVYPAQRQAHGPVGDA